jgi:UDP-N-acetylglucosamine 2-epimerase (non-hydrolysing)
MVYTTLARNNLIAEGIPARKLALTGTPLLEVINANKSKIDKSKVLDELKLKPKGYFLVSAHRQENVDFSDRLNLLLESLEAVAEKYKLPVLISTHPRTASRIDGLDIKLNPKIKFCKPFSFSDYINLQINALAVLSDSGTITEESSILKFTAINLRNTQERPEGMEKASVILAGLTTDSIVDSVKLSIKHKKEGLEISEVIDYLDTNVSTKISRIIRSYVPYINEYVWKKK